MLSLYVSTQTLLWMLARPHPHSRSRHHEQGGQATAEYALVLLGAAAIALLLAAWWLPVRGGISPVRW